MANHTIPDHRPRRTRNRLPATAPQGLTLLLLAIAAGTTPDAAAEPPQVYRCVAPNGSIEFRQYPCHERDSATRIEIDDSRTGWVPPVSADAPASARPKQPRFTKPAIVEQDPALADRCWKKQRQLNDVNRRLRAGYTPVQGERLRQRRRDYEAYLHRFCAP
jgi:hypothetical protein